MFKKRYVIYAIIGGTQGYVGNNISKREDNLGNIDKAKIFMNKKEANEMAAKIEEIYNGNEVSVVKTKSFKRI